MMVNQIENRDCECGRDTVTKLGPFGEMMCDECYDDWLDTVPASTAPAANGRGVPYRPTLERLHR